MLSNRSASVTAAFTLAAATTLIPSAARAVEWNPRAWAGESTITLRTSAPGESEHWFPVWLVVIDDQLYVRLGSRAANRMQSNTTAPYVGVKIAGQQFDRVKTISAPQQVDRVAKAMADKYWSDILVRYMSHPLTLRLVVE